MSTTAITTNRQTAIGTLGSGHSVLGATQARIPVGGKIRAGIMVLTSRAAKLPGAQEFYDRAMSEGRPGHEVAAALRQKFNLNSSPLTPRNVPYFTVRRSDFAIPDAADILMKLYAEDRGDGLHLYRFPIILPVDSWQAVMPHGLKTYTRSQLVYWSEYAPDGTRYCKTHLPVEQDKHNKRAKRAWGGRPVALRAENDGICNPDKCPEYQARKCNLSGELLFYVPGIPGSSAISLPTTSFYSMQQARQKMEMVAFIRGGKISGTHDGRPIFWVTKAQREVSMLDPETGAPKKVKQWLIELEADIDMTALFRANEMLQLKSDAAALMLEGDNDQDGEFDVVEHTAAEDSAQPPPPAEPPEDNERQLIKSARREVMDALSLLDITPDAMDAYARAQLGDDWARSHDKLKKVLHTLHRAADSEALRNEIITSQEARK